MRIKPNRIVNMLLLTLIVLNLIFIFVQSIIPPEESAKESGAVSDVIEEFIPPETKPGEFVQINIRKIAHFVEFATLGALVSAYLVLFMRKQIAIIMSFPAALIVGFFDESIQLISGRGASVKDVWIDFFGFVCASVFLYTVCLIFYLIRKNANKSCQKTTVE